MASGYIKIGGARTHNLKDLNVQIPRDQLVVITGPSGSGKSSLAFDTIFAEGQRKYVESLSAYARLFINQLQKPDVDYIEGLSPAIAIEQRGVGVNPRSTIATTTEIYDYLRLLYAHIGQAHCPRSGAPLSRQSASDIIDRILALPERTRVMLLAPVIKEQQGEFRDVIDRLSREGFVRARVDGQLVELEANMRLKLNPRQKHTIDIVVDRLIVGPKIRARLGDSVETALKWGKGLMLLLHQEVQGGKKWIETVYSERLYSPITGISYHPVTPKHFSFNSPLGACPTCHGLGQKMVFDEDLIVPIKDKTLAAGAIAPWRRGGRRMIVYYQRLLRGVAAHYQQSMEVPYRSLPSDFRDILLHGSGETEIEFQFTRAGKLSKLRRPFEGVLANMERLLTQSQSESTRKRLKAFMSLRPCDVCAGRRLKPEILAVTIGQEAPASGMLQADAPSIPGLSIMDLCALPIEQALRLFQALQLSEFQAKVAADIIREVVTRLSFLNNVGLGYLSLDRESGSLSGGEAQRIRLATQIGVGLVGVLYILDEPSIGLHQRDNKRLLETLIALRDLGNSVVVVEHDEDTIRQADHILDLGPGAGTQGGRLIAQGSVAEICQHPHSLTGKYLSGDYSIPMPVKRKKPTPSQGYLELRGACANNLKNLDLKVPLEVFTCVTGVSGSGKSTLVDDILRRALFRKLYGSKERPGRHKEIRGYQFLDKVIVIDQTPIGRTPRSNPATYTGIFNHIRELFARHSTSRVRGYGVGRFSFNVKGGRCEKCRGDGLIKIEMHFLPPVYVTCEACAGRRYNRETLEVSYKGRNIADVLDLTVDEAVAFFRAIPKICEPCRTLAEVGLGYLKLGQQATTLSGGEAQRIKLATELSRKSTGQTLYILDEPTTGLHYHDIVKLLESLFKLREAGNTLLVIEHNLEVIKTADWIIDLGPEGGAKGGEIIAEGPPEFVAQQAHSYTGQYLRRLLDG
jgi:excinuclease ABC subunit A